MGGRAKKKRRRDSQQTSQGEDKSDQEVRVRRHACGLQASAAGKEGLGPQDQESLTQHEEVCPSTESPEYEITKTRVRAACHLPDPISRDRDWIFMGALFRWQGI